MSSKDDMAIVGQKVDVVLAELRHLRTSGPHFRIVHRYRTSGTDCAPGEEIAGICLVEHGATFEVPLSLGSRLLFDLMARHSRLPQSATQIAAAARSDLFIQKHGSNSGVRQKRTLSRSGIKVCIGRLRGALREVFLQANRSVDPRAVIVATNTDSNEVLYRLRATVDWVHIDHSDFYIAARRRRVL